MHPTLETLLANGPVLTDGAWGTQLQHAASPSAPAPIPGTSPIPIRRASRPRLRRGRQPGHPHQHLRANRIALATPDWPSRSRRSIAPASRSRSGRRRQAPGSSPRSDPAARCIFAGEVDEPAPPPSPNRPAPWPTPAPTASSSKPWATSTKPRSPFAAAKATGLPVVVVHGLRHRQEQDRTMMGATPEHAAEALAAAGADVIGANCGARHRRLRRHLPPPPTAPPTCPSGSSPTPASPRSSTARSSTERTPDEFAAHVRRPARRRRRLPRRLLRHHPRLHRRPARQLGR